MAPRHKPAKNPDGWWQEAYSSVDEIHVSYELKFGQDIIRPGQPIKLKHDRATYKFRCLAHNIKLDVTWFDCVDSKEGGFYSFPLEKLKGPIKPKKSRRRKPIE